MSRPPELKLQQLQYLIAIADHGGLRPAAQMLGVSAAAVSKGLQELENTAGTRLLERQAQGLQLTAAGRNLLARARLIQGEVDQAVLELGAARAATRIRFTVGITPWVSLTLLAPTMLRFTAMRPDVNLRLLDVFGSDYAGLRDGSMDMAIGLAPPEQAGNELSARPLFSYEHTIACRRGHPRQQARHLEELAGQSWLLSHEITQYKPPLRDFFMTHYAAEPAADTPLRGQVHIYRSMHMMEMICNSDLLTVVPWPVIEASRERYPVEALTLKERLPASTTCYVTRKNTAANGCIGDFIEAMMQALSEESVRSRYVHPRVLRSLDIIRSK
ncbi:LysR family transcriptional regulator [Herbaspirillum sp. alder98]|uniref:LysR family transcriptional regulator n=1 Tax=Herbaspirillum sp. alder98 TaxID=2913096 RepID=UPI001CD88368|nr:LysR family transcriptional regulator [Herbaspirillum sp. alder98]MCA1323151.1 LysR family transcriptional regulator [Herbaspirillum sp. alder98]